MTDRERSSYINKIKAFQNKIGDDMNRSSYFGRKTDLSSSNSGFNPLVTDDVDEVINYKIVTSPKIQLYLTFILHELESDIFGHNYIPDESYADHTFPFYCSEFTIEKGTSFLELAKVEPTDVVTMRLLECCIKVMLSKFKEFDINVVAGITDGLMYPTLPYSDYKIQFKDVANNVLLDTCVELDKVARLLREEDTEDIIETLNSYGYMQDFQNSLNRISTALNFVINDIGNKFKYNKIDKYPSYCIKRTSLSIKWMNTHIDNISLVNSDIRNRYDELVAICCMNGHISDLEFNKSDVYEMYKITV